MTEVCFSYDANMVLFVFIQQVIASLVIFLARTGLNYELYQLLLQVRVGDSGAKSINLRV